MNDEIAVMAMFDEGQTQNRIPGDNGDEEYQENQWVIANKSLLYVAALLANRSQ